MEVSTHPASGSTNVHTPKTDEATDYASQFATFVFDGAVGAFRSLSDSLQSVANKIYDFAVDVYCWSLSDEYIAGINYTFSKQLMSLSSIPSIKNETDLTESCEGCLSREHLVLVLKSMKHDDAAKLRMLIETIENGFGHLSVEEWAYVSYMVDAIAVDWSAIYEIRLNKYCELENAEVAARKEAEASFKIVQRDSFLLKNLEHLKLISRLQWAHLAHEVILSELEKYYKSLWNPGYSDATTTSVSLGAAAGNSTVGLSAEVSVTGSKTVEFFLDDERAPGEIIDKGIGISAEVSASLAKTVKGSAALSGSMGTSLYTEWTGAREFAINRFNTLIKQGEHLKNPIIARHLSRSSTLASQKLKPSFDVWAATRSELTDLDNLRNEFVLRRGHIESQLNVLVSISDQEKRLVTPIILNPVNVACFEAPSSNSYFYSAKGALGIEADLGSAILAQVSGAYERKHFVMPDVGYTPICTRLSDPLKAAGKKAGENKRIVDEVAAEFARFKKKLANSWKFLAFESESDVSSRAPSQKTVKAHIRNKNVLDSVNKRFQCLKQDFEFLTQLHVRMAVMAKQKVNTRHEQAMIRDFASHYGAETKEQLLHRMVIANAYFFTQTADDNLRAEIKEFERKLLDPSFSVDQDYLRSHAQFEEYLEYEIIDNKFNVTFKLASEFPLSLGGKLNIELQQRERVWRNCARDGYYVDLVFTVSGEIGDIAALIQSIAAEVYKKMPEAVAKIALKKLEKNLKLIAPTCEVSRETVSQIRWYQPRDYADDAPLRHLFTHHKVNQVYGIGIKGACPVGVADMTYGLSYSNVVANSKRLIFSSKTFWYFIMQNMREHHLGLIDHQTGEIKEASYWNTIVCEQEEVLKKLFLRYANQCVGKAGSLVDEMTLIGRAIEKNEHLTEEEITRFFEAKKEFERAVVEFNADARNYKRALMCFQELMHAHFPHWRERYCNSPLLTARRLAKLEDPIALRAVKEKEQMKSRIRAECAMIL